MKSNGIIDKRMIDKLQDRNRRLYNVLEDGKEKEELKIANEEKLVERFYLLFIA